MSLIDTITPLFNSAKAQWPTTTSGHFITISSDNIVNEHNFIASTMSHDNCWTICTLKNVYLNYGWYKNYEFFALVDKDARVVNEIPRSKWTITSIRFCPVRDWPAEKPSPEVTFSLNNDKRQTFKLDSYTIVEFQQVWDFFLEIDQKCNTIKEVEIYKDYFESKIKNNLSSVTIEKYKQELEQKNDLLKQHEALLEQIKALVNVPNPS